MGASDIEINLAIQSSDHILFHKLLSEFLRERAYIRFERKLFNFPIKLSDLDCSSVVFDQCSFKGDVEILNSKISQLQFIKCSFQNSQLRLIKCNISSLELPNTQQGLTQIDVDNSSHFMNLFRFSSEHSLLVLNLSNIKFKTRDIGISRVRSLSFTNVDFDYQIPVETYYGDGTPHSSVAFSGCNFKEDYEIVNDLTLNVLSYDNCSFEKSIKLSKFRVVALMSFKNSRITKSFIINNCVLNLVEIEADALLYNLLLPRITHFKLSRMTEGKDVIIRLNTSAESAGLYFKDLRISTLDLQFESLKKLMIENCNFQKIDLEGSKIFSEAKFIKTRFEEFSFRGVVFHWKTIFSKCTFQKAPSFSKCEFYFDTSFATSKFKDKTGESEGRYRQLKHQMNLIKNEVEETRFASYEIRARLKNLGLESLFEALLSCIYFIINRCGSSLIQPLVILVLVSIVFHQSVYVYDNFDIKVLGVTNNLTKELSNIDSYFYGVLNFLGPVKLFLTQIQISPSKLSTFWNGLFHSLISSVLWFFFIAGIRKRFKVS